MGTATHLGAFYAQPYYWVLDDQSDAILTPMLTAQHGPWLGVIYRRDFNDGSVNINASAGDENGAAGHLFAKGQFALDETWRYGFDINQASSSQYLRDFRIQGSGDAFLSSSVYLEGFGEGAYTRLDAQSFQGLTTQVNSSTLPIVGPNYRYNFFGQPDGWGGRTMVDVNAFNVTRAVGVRDQQAQFQGTWERPFSGAFGDLWKASLHVQAVGYNATSLGQTPNFSAENASDAVKALPETALETRWPWTHNGAWGQQVLEPIIQVIAAPNTTLSSFANVPNEDSLDLQFTDANLFAWNRYPGLDRMEGGLRANVGLHGAWYFPEGSKLDSLVGQSYRAGNAKDVFPIGSGLENNVSDVVGRISYIPSQYLDFTMRGRFRSTDLAPRYGEAVAGFGVPALRFNVGYVYDTTNPYNLYDTPAGLGTPTSILAPTPRNEASVGLSTTHGRYRLSANMIRDLATNSMVEAGGTAAYEDECAIFSVNVYRRFTALDGDTGSTSVTFQITLKTVGQIGFSAF
jgi:LPS-assembly protein